MGMLIWQRYQCKTHRLIVYSKCDPQPAVLLRLLQPPGWRAVGAHDQRQIVTTEQLRGGVFDRRQLTDMFG
jgi:hypothetical protein